MMEPLYSKNEGIVSMFQLLLIVTYLAFISLGLPDSLLGAAWPTMYPQLAVPVSYAGILSMIISVGTVISSLLSDWQTRRFGTGRVTLFSAVITAVAMFGFSISRQFWQLCLWAIPYGLGGGGVDASLNNYVALHYKSKHMNWLHCMWGVGAFAGPYIMGLVMTRGAGWSGGYRSIALIQAVLAAIVFFSLPLWKRRSQDGGSTGGQAEPKALSLRQIVSIRGVKYSLICMFCYCALEQTAGLWAGSYLTLCKGVSPETAASFASVYFLGITIGRAFCGFLAMKLSDAQLVRLGQGLVGGGILIMLLPLGSASLVGLIICGLGCAPINPCVVHSTPAYFGADRSQAIIGILMASAYMGSCLMPPLFGLISNHISVSVLPWYLIAILALMVLTHELLIQVVGKHVPSCR